MCGDRSEAVSRVVLRGAGIIMFDSHIVCKLCMVLWRDL